MTSFTGNTCLLTLWALQFNFGPVSFSKSQFSNYSPALSLNCQPFYILDNRISPAVKEEAGEATLLSAYKSCNLTWQSPGPTAFWLFKKQQHSRQQSPDETFSYRADKSFNRESFTSTVFSLPERQN